MSASAAIIWVQAGEAIGLACLPIAILFALTWYLRRKR